MELSDEYKDVDPKALLIEQNALLQAILKELQDGDSQDETEEQYQCLNCDDIVPKSDLKSHAKSCHNWQKAIGMDALLSRYDEA